MVLIRFSEESKQMIDFLQARADHSKKERMLLSALRSKLELLSNDPHYGDPIRKRQIPSFYRVKYAVNNLFRIELPQYWRMLYTLTNNDNEVDVIAFVLDVCDHHAYDKRFGYKKR